jgi:osmoprotectant transport system substrate-binding protein
MVSVLAAGTLAVGLAGCGSSDPLTPSEQSGSNGNESGDTIVVGSADFTENVLLAEIYAGALRGAGAKVTTKLRVGTRETLVKALQDKSVTVVPEYSGNLLAFLDKTATATTPEEVYSELSTKAPEGLTVLNQSQAEDSDVLVVTQETATKDNLKTLTSLFGIARRPAPADGTP